MGRDAVNYNKLEKAGPAIRSILARAAEAGKLEQLQEVASRKIAAAAGAVRPTFAGVDVVSGDKFI